MRVILVLLALVLLGSCQGAGIGAVAAVQIHDGQLADGVPPSTVRQDLPLTDARFDGAVFVGHAHAAMTAWVRGLATGVPIFGPVFLTEGERLAIRLDPYEWESLELDDPLPPWAARVFSLEEIAAWGLTFRPE